MKTNQEKPHEKSHDQYHEEDLGILWKKKFFCTWPWNPRKKLTLNDSSIMVLIFKSILKLGEVNLKWPLMLFLNIISDINNNLLTPKEKKFISKQETDSKEPAQVLVRYPDNLNYRG